jgi:hypothetical protein
LSVRSSCSRSGWQDTQRRASQQVHHSGRSGSDVAVAAAKLQVGSVGWGCGKVGSSVKLAGSHSKAPQQDHLIHCQPEMGRGVAPLQCSQHSSGGCVRHSDAVALGRMRGPQSPAADCWLNTPTSAAIESGSHKACSHCRLNGLCLAQSCDGLVGFALVASCSGKASPHGSLMPPGALQADLWQPGAVISSSTHTKVSSRPQGAMLVTHRAPGADRQQVHGWAAALLLQTAAGPER